MPRSTKAAAQCLTRTTTRRDPEDGFERTALVIEPHDASGSIDLVTPDGTRIGQINIMLTETCLMVDMIDPDNRYTIRRALTFKQGKRASIEAGPLVAAHFENPDLDQKTLTTPRHTSNP